MVPVMHLCCKSIRHLSDVELDHPEAGVLSTDYIVAVNQACRDFAMLLNLCMHHFQQVYSSNKKSGSIL